MRGHTVVVDVGKTSSKVSLWTPDGVLVGRRTRTNDRVRGPGYAALDAAGIEAWLAESLAAFANLARIEAIVPVAHGAAFAVLRDGSLHAPPMDYENPVPASERLRYDADRDPFAHTGSPALPDGLNAGAQLHMLETLDPPALRDGAQLVPWPQYWAWVLSGVAAAEVTSLGCHTDLWRPDTGKPSDLAVRRGWAALLPSLRRAADCLGPITPAWAARTGLPTDVRVLCGLHDSNAALLAARGFRELAGGDSTVLSTGTWFVAMRMPAAPVDLAALPASRDCLVNVDAYGQPVPSSRFMGGREIETLTGINLDGIDIAPDQRPVLDALPGVLRDGTTVLPTFAAGCGPFPRARGCWVRMPTDDAARRAAVSLYVALVADVALDLIGAREKLVVEGRFAAAQVFVRALATLRPGTAVYVANAQNDVSYGALRLLDPTLAPSSELERVAPLDVDLDSYRRTWRAEAQRVQEAA